MSNTSDPTNTRPSRAPGYRLDRQVGHLMRRANQRHTGIFAQMIEELTPTQFAALAKLRELGPVSQNRLGRLTAMDAATVKGVIDRLREKRFAATERDPDDRRRLVVRLTPEGEALADVLIPLGHEITALTLAPLTKAEQATFIDLLAKLT